MSKAQLRGSFSWPKGLPELTLSQREISDDFMHRWHESLAASDSLSLIEKFNHSYSVKHRPHQIGRTLEIGAGLGEHIAYEQLTRDQQRYYYALELRSNMADSIKERWPDVNCVVGDCQKHLDFPDGFFSRIIAIHVLEHLTDLPKAIREMHRVLSPQGTFSIVIPCEGGLLYELGRTMTSRRMFEQLYKQSYDWFIEREHVNIPAEVFYAVAPYFAVAQKEYFPFRIPLVHANACIGITLRPRNRDIARNQTVTERNLQLT